MVGIEPGQRAILQPGRPPRIQGRASSRPFGSLRYTAAAGLQHRQVVAAILVGVARRGGEASAGRQQSRGARHVGEAGRPVPEQPLAPGADREDVAAAVAVLVEERQADT